jgi:nucleoside-diphosphate-sugar epimerase
MSKGRLGGLRKGGQADGITGATKRVAELLVQDTAAQSGRCFVAVRFGNVLESRGSCFCQSKRVPVVY